MPPPPFDLLGFSSFLHRKQYCSLVNSLLSQYFNCLFFYFLTLSGLSLLIIPNVKTPQWNTILCEENALVAVDFNSSKSHS